MMAADREYTQLSGRELGCLQWLADGFNQHQIAEELGLSEHSVHQYFESISKKMKAKSTAHAVALAIRQGLIS